MARDALGVAEEPELQPVLDALEDSDCRSIIMHLDQPMTASEVSDSCDIPMSTTYRKLDLLSQASLVDEGTEIRADGHHATKYHLDFEDVVITMEDDRSLTVSITRPVQTADERLASLWGEVRKET